MAKVSIIIPTYNVEQYLKECMDSVVNQTLKDIEIICVDDGSTDSSGKILDEYAQKDSRIKVIHKENGGYGKAMNLGIDNATGEYIGIVEPDDYVELDMYKSLYNAAKEHDVDLVKADFNRFVDKKSRRVFFYRKLDKSGNYYNRVINAKVDFDRLYPRTNILDLIPQNLAENFVIILDDAERKGEKNTANLIFEKLNENNIKYKKSLKEGLKSQLIISSLNYEFIHWY
jgi:glycosyltransferase involved in cell wall biosynthesis